MSAHVFLSHSTADKPAVEQLARHLAEEGIQAWLDKWNLVPGAPWQPAIEEALEESETCAVFIGTGGLSPWQHEEMRVAINRRVTDTKQRFRVIPVLLPGAKRDSLPELLVAGTWVEFRDSLDEPDAFHRLVCGIRGVAPGPGGTQADVQGSPRSLHNLPFAPNPAFTGREAELERLGEHLQKQGGVALTQTVALHGLGGVGKTQLAVEYAWKHLGGYEAVLWVRADSPETLDANLAGLAGVLGLPEASAKELNVQTTAVLGWLKRHQHWLLIADNADNEESAKAVRDRLPPHLGGHVLVTSRLGRWPINMTHLALELLPPQDATRYLQARVAKEDHPAGDDTAARKLTEELGHLPLALEQAASFILELRWSFDQYRERLRAARPELLSCEAPGGTDYPKPVAKTWSITLEQLSPLARVLLRLGAWFAPEAIPRGIFAADKDLLSEALDGNAPVSELAVERAVGELDRFSLIRLSPETVSVHRLLQAVEQDALTKEERTRWLEWAIRLFNAFAPGSPYDVRTWDLWLVLRPHAEALLKQTAPDPETGCPHLDTPPVAKLANQLGALLQARAAYAEAEAPLRRALAINEQHFGPDHPNLVHSLITLASVLNDARHREEAEALLRRALAINEQRFGPDHPKVANSLNVLAWLLKDNNRLVEADRLFCRALAILETARGADHPDVVEPLNGLAWLLKDSNQPTKAEPLFRRTLEITERARGPENLAVVEPLNSLAWLLKTLNRLAEAESLFRRALAINEASYGHDHPEVANSLNNLAILLSATMRLMEAEPLFRRALQIDEMFFGPDHPRVATGRHNLGKLLLKANRLTEAEPLLRRALQIDETSFGADHPNVARDLHSLGKLLLESGQWDKAEPMIRRGLRIREQTFEPDHSEVAHSLEGLASLLQQTRRPQEAEGLLRRGWMIWEKVRGPEHPHVLTGLQKHSALLRTLGRPDEAEPLEARAQAIRSKQAEESSPDF